MMKPTTFALLVILAVGNSVSTSTAAEAEKILLWPDGAPGSEGKAGEEKVRVTDGGDHVISNIHHPSLTPYLPTPEQATGAAMIIAPGGGHRELWSTHEGHNLARWLSERGVAAFVVYYRLAREEGSTYSVDGEALADMQRAVKVVRSRADEWRIKSDRIGVMGFSAGGEVAALADMRPLEADDDSADPIDRVDSKPDFQALIYPGSSRRFEASENSSPVFIVCGYADRPDISRGMAEVYLKYKEAGVPAELHIYAKAGHGFGMRDRLRGGVAGWPDRLLEWMGDFEMLTRD